jgi:ubiquinone/menaquinone biosynthesis C-methylase UbiE
MSSLEAWNDMTTQSENNAQYQTDKNLSIRQRLHQQYSTNSQGLMPWLREQITIRPGDKILELGCGNGSLWEGYLTQISSTVQLTLSDYSQGMVDQVTRQFDQDSRVNCLKIDAQSIPFEDGTFDIVIANHTLHTVPNIALAIREIRRVLKPHGTFYTSANGNHGMEYYLHTAIQSIQPSNTSFSDQLSFNLQNGVPQLETAFRQVARRDYPDSLRITKTADLIAWIESTRTPDDGIDDALLKQLATYFEALRQRDGAIMIPKQVGLLIANN